MVVGECILWIDENIREIGSDLGNVYVESQMGAMLDWIAQHIHEPRILHADELEPDDPELTELLELGAKTVVYLPLYHQNQFWGWVEIWEARYKRQFTDEELQISSNYSELLSAII